MIGLVGCASAPPVVVVDPVGPGPVAGSQGTGDGSLVVYSARTPGEMDLNRETWLWNNDFGKNEFMDEPAHTDYTIYARNGEVFQRVHNARSVNDGTPTLVTLPAGSYTVEAAAVNCDGDYVRVLMTVVIKTGQTTMAHLEGGWNPGDQATQTELAKLPCGRAVGWRAPESGFAGSQQPGSQAN
jgi:hypothetical protein